MTIVEELNKQPDYLESQKNAAVKGESVANVIKRQKLPKERSFIHMDVFNPLNVEV